MPSRRQFLRGQFSALKAHTALTPPWALADFGSLCTRCGECAKACPTQIIVSGDGGFPSLDYQLGECSFCGDCAKACEPGALVLTGQAPWNRTIEFDPSCLAKNSVVCRSCSEACETSAIHFQPRPGGVALPQLADADCTGCGACVAICPSQSIRVRQSASRAALRTPDSEVKNSQRRAA